MGNGMRHPAPCKSEAPTLAGHPAKTSRHGAGPEPDDHPIRTMYGSVVAFGPVARLAQPTAVVGHGAPALRPGDDKVGLPLLDIGERFAACGADVVLPFECGAPVRFPEFADAQDAFTPGTYE